MCNIFATYDMRALRWDMRGRMLHMLQIYVATYVADMLFNPPPLNRHHFELFNFLFQWNFNFDFCFEFGSGIISVHRVLDRAGCVRGGIEPLTFQTAIGRDAGVVGSKTLGRQK